MRLPEGLRRLDDRVLGAIRPGAPPSDPPRGSAVDTAPEQNRPDPDAEGPTDGSARKTRTTDDTERRERPDRTPPREETRTVTQADAAESAPRTRRGNGDGLPSFLAVVWRVSRLVLLALALLMVIAMAFVLLPANEQNVIVRNVLELAERVAGPFKDVFTLQDPDRMRLANYGLAAAVYFVASTVVGRLPTGSKKKS